MTRSRAQSPATSSAAGCCSSCACVRTGVCRCSMAAQPRPDPQLHASGVCAHAADHAYPPRLWLSSNGVHPVPHKMRHHRSRLDHSPEPVAITGCLTPPSSLRTPLVVHERPTFRLHTERLSPTACVNQPEEANPRLPVVRPQADPCRRTGCTASSTNTCTAQWRRFLAAAHAGCR